MVTIAVRESKYNKKKQQNKEEESQIDEVFLDCYCSLLLLLLFAILACFTGMYSLLYGQIVTISYHFIVLYMVVVCFVLWLKVKVNLP